jgi:serine/threonine-protein phosphatase PGAM5
MSFTEAPIVYIMRGYHLTKLFSNTSSPAQIIPSRPELDIDEDLAKNGPRIEEAFQKYFYRSTDENSVQNHVNKHDKHEFEIVVCHGNVIRYFFCRALQLPPEAWLRLSTYNCSLTYLMIKPSGNVSCRMLGDIGHLGYGHSTFSQNHGFVP